MKNSYSLFSIFSSHLGSLSVTLFSYKDISFNLTLRRYKFFPLYVKKYLGLVTFESYKLTSLISSCIAFVFSR